jgi:phosphotransferase system IIA component
MGDGVSIVRPSRRRFAAPQDEEVRTIAFHNTPHAEEAHQRRLEARTMYPQIVFS